MTARLSSCQACQRPLCSSAFPPSPRAPWCQIDVLPTTGDQSRVARTLYWCADCGPALYDELESRALGVAA
jgi:hypothetical protein